jgi:hypothetical protein
MACRASLPLATSILALSCGGGGGSAPTPVAAAPTPTVTPTATPPVGSVALLSASLPSGSTVPTQRLGVGHAAPTLSFRYAVRMEQGGAGLLTQVWVRTEAARCMGANAGTDFAPGETKTFQSANVSFQQGTDPPPCTLPYTTTAVEITVARSGVVILSDRFPMTYTFPLPQ